MKKKILTIGIIVMLVTILIVLTGCENNNSVSENKQESSIKNSKEVELYPVKDEAANRYGYVNKKGEWVVEPKYVSAWGFDNETGLAKARMPKGDFSVSFINKNGETVLDGYGSYSSHSFCNGYAVVDTDVKVNTYSTKMLIDKDGNTIIPSGKYEKMTDVSKDGIIGVAESTISGIKYMNLNGTVVLERKHKELGSVEDSSGFNECGYAYDKHTWFDEKGNEIEKKDYGEIDSLNDKNYGFVQNDNYMRGIYVIKDGNVEYITDYIYKATTGFNNNNIAGVKEEADGLYYLINAEGKKIDSKTYKACSMLLDGKFVVTLEDGKHQVLNADGSILVNTF